MNNAIIKDSFQKKNQIKVKTPLIISQNTKRVLSKRDDSKNS